MRVLTDLDNVLGDFTRHVRDHFGAHPNDIPNDELWARVDSVADFWLTMPLKYGATDLWDVIQPYDPVIITGCPKLHYEKAAADKVTWAKWKFGEDVAIITCLSRDKQKHLLTPDDILIDDFSNNVKRWRKAGGRALRYITYEQTISDLRTLLHGQEPD
jgi:hypothetical protein